jgi:ATP-dependent Lon protease
VIVPDRNEGDVEEISEQEREGLEFVYADDIGDVLGVALERNGRASRRARDEKPASRASERP